MSRIRQLHDTAAEIELDTATTHYFRGQSYHAGGDYEQAIEEYNRSINIDPNGLQYYIARAESATEAGRFGQALIDYGELTNRDPHNQSRYIFLQGSVQFYRGVKLVHQLKYENAKRLHALQIGIPCDISTAKLVHDQEIARNCLEHAKAAYIIAWSHDLENKIYTEALIDTEMIAEDPILKEAILSPNDGTSRPTKPTSSPMPQNVILRVVGLAPLEEKSTLSLLQPLEE